MTTLLYVDDVRIDVDGVPACEGLTLETTGSRAIVVGAPRVLFEAVTGLRPIARGTVLVNGAAPSPKTCAAAPLDPPLPPKWKALEYVTWSARLAGHRNAKASALEAINALKLDAYLKSPLLNLPAHARRAVVIAAAMATAAPVVAFEDPMSGLAEELATALGGAIVDAFAERLWLCFSSLPRPTSPLAQHADDVLVAEGATSFIRSTSTRFVARIHGDPALLGARLAARGVAVEVRGSRMIFDLGGTVSTAELFAMSVEASATIVELHPLS